MQLDYDKDEERRCNHCETKVSKQFQRVFGDRNNEVHGCHECMTYRELADGQAAEL